MEAYLKDKEIHGRGYEERWFFSCKDGWYMIDDLFSGRSEISHYNPKTEKCKRMACLEWYSEYSERSIPPLVDPDEIFDYDNYNPFLGFETDPFDLVETFETPDEFKKILR